MPKATRKPGARPVPPFHPDAEGDEAGTHWTQLTPEQLADWRWAAAFDALEQHNDARALVGALLDLGLPPEEVRADLRLWLDGKLPPWPMLSTKDQYTLRAVAAYRRTPFKRNVGGGIEGAERKAERVLKTQPPEKPGLWRKHGVTASGLLNVKNCSGNQYLRICKWRNAVGRLHGADLPGRDQEPPAVLTTRRPRR
jgi:hypothetical protein